MRRRARSEIVVALVLAACSSPSPAPGSSQPAREGAPPPPSSAPRALDVVALPALPPDADEGAVACARDYHAIASAPLPERAAGQSFDAWYAGPFQGWVERYNALRARCDEVFATLEAGSPEAQVVLGAQSIMHERLGQEAIPLEEHAQMFLMGRYWTLGAACTYASCAVGPLEAWSTLCRERAAALPPCPPVEEPPAEP